MDELSRIMAGLKATGDPYYLFWLGLRNIFKSMNMTQDQFAKHLGIAQSYASRVLGGTKIPKRETIVKICDALKMSFDEISAKAGKDGNVSYREDVPKVSEKSERLVPFDTPLTRRINKIIDAESKLTPANIQSYLQKAMGQYQEPGPDYLPFISVTGDNWVKTGKSPLLFDQNWALSVGASGNLGVYRAEDGFMEPIINQGDFVVVDLSASRLVHDKIYLIYIQGNFLTLARYKQALPSGPLSNRENDENQHSILRGTLENTDGQSFLDLGNSDIFKVVGRAMMVVRAVL